MNLKGLLENKEDREWEKNREARKGEGKHKQSWEEIEEENRELGKGLHTRVLHMYGQWHFPEEILHTSSLSELESLIKCGWRMRVERGWGGLRFPAPHPLLPYPLQENGACPCSQVKSHRQAWCDPVLPTSCWPAGAVPHLRGRSLPVDWPVSEVNQTPSLGEKWVRSQGEQRTLRLKDPVSWGA